MENVVLIIHLILAFGLIGIVLLQRSEGGGLGMGKVASHETRSSGSDLTINQCNEQSSTR